MIMPIRMVCNMLFAMYVDVPVCIASGRSPDKQTTPDKKEENNTNDKCSLFGVGMANYKFHNK